MPPFPRRSPGMMASSARPYRSLMSMGPGFSSLEPDEREDLLKALQEAYKKQGKMSMIGGIASGLQMMLGGETDPAEMAALGNNTRRNFDEMGGVGVSEAENALAAYLEMQKFDAEQANMQHEQEMREAQLENSTDALDLQREEFEARLNEMEQQGALADEDRDRAYELDEKELALRRWQAHQAAQAQQIGQLGQLQEMQEKQAQKMVPGYVPGPGTTVDGAKELRKSKSVNESLKGNIGTLRQRFEQRGETPVGTRDYREREQMREMILDDIRRATESGSLAGPDQSHMAAIAALDRVGGSPDNPFKNESEQLEALKRLEGWADTKTNSTAEANNYQRIEEERTGPNGERLVKIGGRWLVWEE